MYKMSRAAVKNANAQLIFNESVPPLCLYTGGEKGTRRKSQPIRKQQREGNPQPAVVFAALII